MCQWIKRRYQLLKRAERRHSRDVHEEKIIEIGVKAITASRFGDGYKTSDDSSDLIIYITLQTSIMRHGNHTDKSKSNETHNKQWACQG